jgi:hypothetical protein
MRLKRGLDLLFRMKLETSESLETSRMNAVQRDSAASISFSQSAASGDAAVVPCLEMIVGDGDLKLAPHDIQPSMSRVGNPYDNAKAESFMKTLKQEEVDGRSYRDAHQAKEMIGSFIEQVYNRQRLHSALAYQPPAEFEANLQAESALPTASRSLATALWGARSRAACYAASSHQPGSGAVAKQTPIATCS